MTKLRDWLETNEMTQAQFAARVGVNQATIAKLCKPAPKLSIEMALNIERETAGEVAVEVWPQFAALASRVPLAAPVGAAE